MESMLMQDQCRSGLRETLTVAHVTTSGPWGSVMMICGIREKTRHSCKSNICNVYVYIHVYIYIYIFKCICISVHVYFCTEHFYIPRSTKCD